MRLRLYLLYRLDNSWIILPITTLKRFCNIRYFESLYQKFDRCVAKKKTVILEDNAPVVNFVVACDTERL